MDTPVVNGICVDAKVVLADRQALWNRGVRFVYADGYKTNGALRNVYGDCQYMGFKFGVWVRLRYPPEEGSAMTQADWLWENIKNYKMDLPVALELEKGPEVLSETNSYRYMVEKFIEYFRSYTEYKVPLIIKAERHIIDWLTPSSLIVKQQLWINEPGKVVNYWPWPGYVLRSYSHRSVDGTPAEWVEFPGDLATFKNWYTNEKAPVMAPSTPPTPTPTPTPGTLSDHDMLVEIFNWVKGH